MAEVSDFVNHINKEYESEVVYLGGYPPTSRFSAGSFPLDAALGGGWPFGRICILAGQESSGKTTLCLKAAKSVKEYDHATRQHKSKCGTEFSPCRVLYCDLEGALDPDWAQTLGMDVENTPITVPNYGEQAVDVIDDAIRENVFDLIIVDSIAAISPTAEVENSAEDQLMGGAARLINKAFRKWTMSLNTVVQETKRPGACVLCINQFREKLGVMYGDNRVLPGGKGQAFAASIIVFLKPMKYEDDSNKELAWGEISGVTKKNKTAIPRQEFTTTIALKNTENSLVGEIDDTRQVVKLAKQLGIVEQKGSKLCYSNIETTTEKAFIEEIRNTDTFTNLYNDCIFAVTGQKV